MKNIVITSGSKYLDIDAYSGCIVYALFLKALNIPAKAVSTAPINESVPELIQQIKLTFDDYTPTENDEFILMDVSNPDFFDVFVIKENIIEIIDHHTGFENYWKTKKSVKTQIEFIGSVCTIIYEKIIEFNKAVLLTPDVCKLLIAAILDNTLNLKADITTKRDIKAYNELLKLGNLDQFWREEYFSACEENIINNLEQTIINSLKHISNTKKLPEFIGQLTIFNSKKLLNQLDLINQIFAGYDSWMLNIISLKDGKSYILAGSEKNKSDLETIFNSSFKKDILILDKFMLRKEIIKIAQQ